jgi:hypothetical protein
MRTKIRNAFLVGTAGALVAFVLHGCGSDDEVAVGTDSGADTARPDVSSDVQRPENTGQSCTQPSDCYAGLDAGSLKGAVQCLDRVTGGYCTHLCEKDEDCCAVSGECKSGFKQVCSPFESTGQKMCFLSCEATDIRASDAGAPDGGTLDETTYCTTYATSEFACRSSGGGSGNRKVCVPGGTAGDGGVKDGGDGGPTDAGDGG